LLTDIIPLKQTFEITWFSVNALRGDFLCEKEEKSTVLKRDIRQLLNHIFGFDNTMLQKIRQTVKSADKMFKIIIKMPL